MEFSTRYDGIVKEVSSYSKNEMDARCERIVKEFLSYMKKIAFVPISRFEIDRSTSIDCYIGLLQASPDLIIEPKGPSDKPLRLPLQDVYGIGGIGTLPDDTDVDGDGDDGDDMDDDDGYRCGDDDMEDDGSWDIDEVDDESGDEGDDESGDEGDYGSGDEGDDGSSDEGDDGSDDDGDDEIDDVDDEDGQGDSEDDEDGQGDSEDDEDTEVRLFRLTFDGEKHFMGSIDHLEEHRSVQELVQHILPRLRLVRYGRPDGHTFIFSDHGGSYFEIDEAMGLRWEHFVDMLRAVYVDDQYDEEVMRLEALDVVEIREDNTWFYVGSVFMASSLAELERGVSDVRAELPHAYGLCVYTSHEKFPFGWPGEVLARRSWGWEWVLKNVTMVYFQ